MEIVIKDVTDDEIDTLIENDIDWIPDDILGSTRDVSITGSREYINHALELIGRESRI